VEELRLSRFMRQRAAEPGQGADSGTGIGVRQQLSKKKNQLGYIFNSYSPNFTVQMPYLISQGNQVTSSGELAWWCQHWPGPFSHPCLFCHPWFFCHPRSVIPGSTWDPCTHQRWHAL
jgi:hypothetical protein